MSSRQLQQQSVHSTAASISIDALVDSDNETADIFDDNEEDDPNTASFRHSPSGKEHSVVVLTNPRLPLHNQKVEDDESESEEDASMSSSSSTDSKGGDGDPKSDDSASGEDYTDDEDEGEDGYKPGGYHPVKVGETYNQRYVGKFEFETLREHCSLSIRSLLLLFLDTW